MAQQVQETLAILRLKQVMARTGLSRSSIYAKESAGAFPARISLGEGRAVGWVESEVSAWLVEQIQKSRKAA